MYDLIAIKSSGVACVVSNHEHCAAALGWLGREFIYKQHAFLLADAVTVLSKSDELFYRSVGVNATYIANPFPLNLSKVHQTQVTSANVLWVGRFSSEKQPLDAVDIFLKVRERLHNAVFYMYGAAQSDEIRTAIEQKLKAAGASNAVHIRGHVDDMIPVYQNASIYLCTSITESFSLSLYEAQAFGIPTVMYELPHLELARDGSGIISVPQGDTVAASDAVVKLLQDEASRAQLGLQARHHFEEFSKNNNSRERWAALLRHLELSSGSYAPQCRDNSFTIRDVGHIISAISAQLEFGLDQQIAIRARAEAESARQEAACAHADWDKLRHEYDIFLRSTCWRATRPIRTVSSFIPAGLRNQLRRALKLLYWMATPHRIPERLAFRRSQRK
jgi:hypothetical protein